MLLTTITPYWGRPEMLKKWVRALEGARVPGETSHILFCVGGDVLPELVQKSSFIHAYRCEGPPAGIGHYHNMGVELVHTPWVMKLDVDTIPHIGFFRALLRTLHQAPLKAWFNVGMIYLSPQDSAAELSLGRLPMEESRHAEIIKDLVRYSSAAYKAPQATNWVCRKADYQRMGGCDECFRGYGWEDYQQIYGLESQERGEDALPGVTTLENITHRCRDEIARPKALQLFTQDSRLCLLHHWHPVSADHGYRAHMNANRDLLFHWVQDRKRRDSRACSAIQQNA